MASTGNDMGDKLLNNIKRIYVNSLACVRIKRGENKCFRIYSGMRQSCIMSPQALNVYMDAVMKELKKEIKKVGEELKMGMGKGERMEIAWPLVCR